MEQGKEDHAEDAFKDFLDAAKEGDSARAAQASVKIWEEVAENSKEESPWLRNMSAAHKCEAQFNWAGAEAAYLEALKAAEDSNMLQNGAYRTLSAFYDLMNRDDESFQATREATRAARREGMALLIQAAVLSEAKANIKRGMLSQAKELIDEAFAMLSDNDPLPDLQRASVLLTRADFFLSSDEWALARTGLDEAYLLVWKQEEMHFAAGPQSEIATFWSCTARLHAKEGNSKAAVDCGQKAVERRRIISQLPQLEGPYKHNSLAAALRNLGRAQLEIDDPGAGQSFDESDSIRASIGLEPLPR